MTPQEPINVFSLAQIDPANDKLFLLDHNWMTPANMKRHIDNHEKPEDQKIHFSAELSERMRLEKNTAHYIDPISELDPRFGGEWLAASEPVVDSKWIAIVQERRDVALKPLEDLRNVFFRSGYFALTVFSVMLGVFWILLRRASD